MGRIVVWAGLALAMVAGTMLRIWRIDQQILMEDEWHGLLTLAERGYGWIATHFGMQDICIPLTLLHKALADTVGLDETIARLLPLTAGIATIVAIPWLLRRHLGAEANALFALLLAISPLLVLYSRVSRPYAIAVLLVWVACAALHAELGWKEHAGGRGHRGLFAASAGLAVWFLPIVAPMLFFAWAVRIGARGWFAAGLGAASVGGALLLPPLWVDHAALFGKAGGSSPDLATIDGLLALFTGVWPRTLAGALCVLAAYGVRFLCRKSPHFFVPLTIAAIGHVISVLALQALGTNGPAILARYCLPVLPLVLAGVAVATLELARKLAVVARVPRGVFVTGILALLVVLGPWRDAYWFPNQWTGHHIYQSDFETVRDPLEGRLLPARVSAAYEMLATLPPGSVVVAECPFPQDAFANAYVGYQRFHKQRVVGALAADLLPNSLPCVKFGAGRREPAWVCQATDLAGLRQRGVSWLIVHKDLRREFPLATFTQPIESRAIEAKLRELLGAPTFEDDLVVAFRIL